MEIKLQDWGDNSASKLLVFKHTDLSSHLQNLHKKPGMVAYACNSTDQRKREGSLGLSGCQSSGVGELQAQRETLWRMGKKDTEYRPPLASTFMYMTPCT